MLDKFIVYFIGHQPNSYSRLNIYDTRSISCVICKEVIGEVDYDAEIIRPKCGQCSNPTLHPKDKMPYLISH
jgi:hypothetical protein